MIAQDRGNFFGVELVFSGSVCGVLAEKKPVRVRKTVFIPDHNLGSIQMATRIKTAKKTRKANG